MGDADLGTLEGISSQAQGPGLGTNPQLQRGCPWGGISAVGSWPTRSLVRR